MSGACRECVKGMHANCEIMTDDGKCACLADGHRTIQPYAGSSGHSGSSASRDRAESEDRSGRTAERQERTEKILRRNGTLGVTVAELRETTGWHHGQASGALSDLHKAGRIARLSERRGRCHVYVAKPYVMGRETEEPGRGKTKYPFEKGDVIVLGPETIKSKDGQVISHQGVNYYRLPEPFGGDEFKWSSPEDFDRTKDLTGEPT